MIYFSVIPAKPANLSIVSKTIDSAMIHWTIPFPMVNFPVGLCHRIAYQHQWDTEKQWQVSAINLNKKKNNKNHINISFIYIFYLFIYFYFTLNQYFIAINIQGLRNTCPLCVYILLDSLECNIYISE